MSDFGRSFGGGRRASGRSPIAEPAIVSTTSSCVPATVVDISRRGTKLRGVPQLAVDEEVLLKVGKSHLFGTVRWMRGDQCGVEFDQALGRSELDELRKREWAGYLIRGNLDRKLAMEDWNSSFVR